MTREEKNEMVRTAAKERIPVIRNLILSGAPAEDFFLCNVVASDGTSIQYKVGC